MTDQKPEETDRPATEDGAADFVDRLKAAREEAGLDRPDEADPPAGVAAYALRLATELVAGVIVGGALGWWFDKALGTTPLGMIFFLLLGFTAGVWNVVRAVKRMNDLNAQNSPDKD